MRKLLLLTFFAFVFSPLVMVHAEEYIPPGQGFVSVKLDHLRFTSGDIKKFGPEYGPYIGLEAYSRMTRDIFLGGEIGYFNYDSCGCVFLRGPGADPIYCDADKEITYIPIELNAKYVIGTSIKQTSIVLGAGVSYNHVRMEVSYPGMSLDEDEWLLGAQVSLDVNYDIGRFFLGINGKYQITEELKVRAVHADANLNNWRAGGHIGMRF